MQTKLNRSHLIAAILTIGQVDQAGIQETGPPWSLTLVIASQQEQEALFSSVLGRHHPKTRSNELWD